MYKKGETCGFQMFQLDYDLESRSSEELIYPSGNRNQQSLTKNA